MTKTKYFIKKRIHPIAHIDDSYIVGIKGLTICFYDLKSNKLIRKIKIKRTFKERLISKSNLISRAYRFYPRASCIVDRKIYFALKGFCYSYNLDGNSLKAVAKFRNGMSSPLSLCRYKDGVIFGEYFNNAEKTAVNICFASENKDSPIILTSVKGIRHIHGIIPTDNNEEFIVFTGDDGDEAGIGLLSLGDKPLFRKLAYGDQIYRGCFGAVSGDKLIYATDSPFTQNYVVELNLKTLEFNKLFPIQGSVLYGMTINHEFFFSTAVETNLSKNDDGTNKKIKIDGKSGGILNDSSFLYSFDMKNGNMELVAQGKKDCWDIHYFGFGSFLFAPSNSGALVFYSKTLKKMKRRIYFRK